MASASLGVLEGTQQNLTHTSCVALEIPTLVCLSVGPPLWFRLKHLNSNLMDCLEIWYKHSWSPDDEP